MKLWAGRFSKEIDQKTNDFNSSIKFDSRMIEEDIKGSIAHATMLGACGIIEQSEAELICKELEQIYKDIQNETLPIDPNAEDVHTFVEGELTQRIGVSGKRLHTARSRNDQVALDVRLYLKKECDALYSQIEELVTVLCKKAMTHKGDVMPGYTHLQRAQPITFGHHLMAYAEMFLRDLGRLKDAKARMDELPLGAGALAGTTYPLNRSMTAELLGFSRVTNNSLDSVADRDFCVEIASAIALAMVHLSRFSEEIILWCSWEFKFVELDDAFSTGSSIMPQKKNPDIAELVRGKSGRVIGDVVTLLTMLKGLPLAYNKDMQEDKEPVFDAVDTVEMCLPVFAAMLDTMTVRTDNMRKAAGHGFINATDCADYLTKKGMPFRDAYTVTGHLVAQCTARGKTLEELTLEELKAVSELFEADVYDALNLENCMALRSSYGGPAVAETARQIGEIEQFIQKIKENR